MNYGGEIGNGLWDYSVGNLIHLRKKGLPSITKRQEKVLEEIKERLYNWDGEPGYSDIFSKELSRDEGITTATLVGLEKKGFIILSKDDYYFKKEGYIVYATPLMYLWWIEKTGELPSWAEYELENPKDYQLSAEFEASQRKCGACGETGHNARTCKSKIVPFSTGGLWNEETYDGKDARGFPLVDGSFVAMISKIVDGEVLKEPKSYVNIPRMTWEEEPITMTWGELDEKCKKQNLVSIGESTYSGSYLRDALAYLPKNTVLTLYTGNHYPLKATFEYGGEEWIFFLAPRVEAMYAENLKDWSEQEMKSHGKDVSFKDFIKKEIKSHGNIDLVDWAKHEEKSHKERYGAEIKSKVLDNKTYQNKYMAQDKTGYEIPMGTDGSFYMQIRGDKESLQKAFKDWKPKAYPYEKRITQDSLSETCGNCGKENVHYQFYLPQKNSRYGRMRFVDGATYCKYDENNCGANLCSDCANDNDCENCGAEICSTCADESEYIDNQKICVPCREDLEMNAETFEAGGYSFTEKLDKYEFTDNGDSYLITYGNGRPDFNLPKDSFGQFYTIERFVEELNKNQEQAVSDVFNFLWNKTNNGHLDDILMNRAETFEESNFGSIGEGNNFGQMRAEEPVIEEPDFIPDGDGRALGQQTSSINLSPLHAESKVLSKTNLVIAGFIGLSLWKGKQILDTAKSSLKQSAENKKKGCSTCNSNGTVRKNHTQVKQSEYSVNQINPVEAEGQNDIHGAEGISNPRYTPSPQPFGYPSKSLKMW